MGLAADLVLDARLRAGLSQRELARRAGTSQSAVVRYETGATEPSFAVVERLLAACGLEMRITLAEPDDSVERTAAALAGLSPEGRLRTAANWERLRRIARPVDR